MKRTDIPEYKSYTVSKKMIQILFTVPLLLVLVWAYCFDLFGITGDMPLINNMQFLTPSSKTIELLKDESIEEGFLDSETFYDEEMLYRLAPSRRQQTGAAVDDEVQTYLVVAGLDANDVYNPFNLGEAAVAGSELIEEFLNINTASGINLFQLDDMLYLPFISGPMFPFYMKPASVVSWLPFRSIAPPGLFGTLNMRSNIQFIDIIGVSPDVYRTLFNVDPPMYIMDTPDYVNNFPNLTPLASHQEIQKAYAAFDDYTQKDESIFGKHFFIGYDKQTTYTLKSGYLKYYNGFDADTPYSEYIGYNADATFIHDEGINVTNSLIVGYDTGVNGTYRLNGGQLFARQVVIGKGGIGTFKQDGGSHEFESMSLGFNRDSQGNYILNQGTAHGFEMTVGYGGKGTYTQDAGNLDIDYLLTVGKESYSDGQVTVNDGSLTTQLLRIGEFGTGTVILNGGSISADATTLGSALSLSRDDCAALIPDEHLDAFWTELVNLDYIDQSGQATSTLWLLDYDQFLNSIDVTEYGLDPLVIFDFLHTGLHTSSGTFTQNGGSNDAGHLIVSPGVGSTGLYEMNAGDLTCEYIYLGYPADASFIQTGGSVTVYNDLILGLCDPDDPASQIDNSDLLYGSHVELFGGTFSVYNIRGLCGFSSLWLDSLAELQVGGAITDVHEFVVGYNSEASYAQVSSDYTVGNLYLGYDAGANGAYVMTNSSLSTIFVTYDLQNIFGDVYVGYGGIATLDMTNSSLVTTDMYVGHDVGSEGTLTISGSESIIDSQCLLVGTGGSIGKVTHNSGLVRTESLLVGSNGDQGSGLYKLETDASLETDYLTVANTGSFQHRGSATVFSGVTIDSGGSYKFESGSLTLQYTTEPIGNKLYSVKSNFSIEEYGVFVQSEGVTTVYGDLNVAEKGSYNLNGGSLLLNDDISKEWVDPEDIYDTDLPDVSTAGVLTENPGKMNIAGTFNHNHGSVIANNTMTIESTGSYNMNTSDSLKLANASYGNMFVKSNLNIKGEFTQTNGTLSVDGDIVIASSARFTLYKGNIDVNGPIYESGSIYESERFFLYDGGLLSRKDPSDNDNSWLDRDEKLSWSGDIIVNGHLELVGGTINASSLIVNSTLWISESVTSDGSTVVLQDELRFGSNSQCSSVGDASLTVKLDGDISIVDIESTKANQMTGLNDITLEFVGSNNLMEVAGRDYGYNMSAFSANFAFYEINLADNALLTLVDLNDNHPWIGGDEVLYVSHLILGNDAILDLNGITIYVKNAPQIDNGEVINGDINVFASELDMHGFATPVPEPGAVWLSFSGVLVLLYNLKRFRSRS